MTTAFRWIRDHYTVITAVSGLILIAMGVAILTGEIYELNTQAQKCLDKVGLDSLYNF